MLLTLLKLLFLYQLKHFICDYPLQTSYMLGKFKSGWRWLAPLSLHAGIHGVATLLIALRFDVPLQFALFPALFDFICHFTMDRIKASPNLLGRFKALSATEYMSVVSCVNKEDTLGSKAAKARLRGNTLFWIFLGFDQLFHHVTDLVCAIVIWFAGMNAEFLSLVTLSDLKRIFLGD